MKTSGKGKGGRKEGVRYTERKNSGKEEKKGDVLRTEVHRVQTDSCVTGQVQKQQMAGTQLPTLFEVPGCPAVCLHGGWYPGRPDGLVLDPWMVMT